MAVVKMIRTLSDLKLSGHSFLDFMQDLEDYIEEELEQTPTYITLDNCDYLDILFESYYAKRYVSPLIDLLYKSNNDVVDGTLIRNITIIMYQNASVFKNVAFIMLLHILFIFSPS